MDGLWSTGRARGADRVENGEGRRGVVQVVACLMEDERGFLCNDSQSRQGGVCEEVLQAHGRCVFGNCAGLVVGQAAECVSGFNYAVKEEE